MKKIILILSLCINYWAYSQSIEQPTLLSSSGTSKNQQMVWTLGDFQTTTYSGNNLVVTQGFLQVYEQKATLTEFVDNNIDMQIEVFPNPVINELNIKFEADKVKQLVFELYTVGGQLLHSEQVSSKTYTGTLGFTAFNNGMYILKIKSKTENYIKTYKIFHHD